MSMTSVVQGAQIYDVIRKSEQDLFYFATSTCQQLNTLLCFDSHYHSFSLPLSPLLKS